jgi:hypothetical protein
LQIRPKGFPAEKHPVSQLFKVADKRPDVKQEIRPNLHLAFPFAPFMLPRATLCALCRDAKKFG